MIEIRLRTRTSAAHIQSLTGKVLGPADYDVLLTGATTVRKPDGRPLAVYLPGALAEHAQDEANYEVLHSLKGATSSNRGLASGSRRLRRGSEGAYASRTESLPIASTVIGSVDPMGQQRYCRLTAWTGRNLPQWEQLHPLLRAIAEQLRAHVPDRYAVQAAEIAKADPAWVVPGTPFTTITVNNSYSTGVHTDKGDLEAGFSTIACLRRGTYTGGQLVFPEYRVAVDMHDGDLLLMDAHDWHGNCAMTCGCGERLKGPCTECGAERISIVSYMRSKVAECGSPAEEAARALAGAEKRSKIGEPAPA